PVVLRAQRAGIPTALVEENAVPGLTTRWLARGARQVHLGFPEARDRLSPGAHTEIFALGNPVRPPEPGDPRAARRALGLDPDRPTVFAFGGSQGAQTLNYAGAALFLAEHDLTAHALAQLIGELLGAPARLASLAARARARGHPNASREIVSRILTLVPR